MLSPREKNPLYREAENRSYQDDNDRVLCGVDCYLWVLIALYRAHSFIRGKCVRV